MMSDPQKYGGASTYAKRYAFCNGFGILTADEDLDAKSSTPKPQGPAQATAKTRQWMIEQFGDLKVKALAYAIDMAWIMPDASIEAWPLEHVPTSAQGMTALTKKIAAHQ